MSATNEHEVNDLIADNLEMIFDDPHLWTHIRNAKRRLRRIRREKQKSWFVYELN
jgi:ABC-type Zn uptake system ZnuABC Zn-binding protein ZnuA